MLGEIDARIGFVGGSKGVGMGSRVSTGYSRCDCASGGDDLLESPSDVKGVVIESRADCCECLEVAVVTGAGGEAAEPGDD